MNTLTPGTVQTYGPGVHVLLEPLHLTTGCVLEGASATNAPGVGVELVGDVVVDAEARFWAIRRLKLRGRLRIAAGCSQYAVSDLVIERGGLTAGGSNWLARFVNVYVRESDGVGLAIGDAAAGTGCGLAFLNCLAHLSGSWGWHVTNQVGLSLVSCAADANTDGGFLFVASRGTALSLTAESNPVGISAWDSPMQFSTPWVDGAPEPYRLGGDERAEFVRPWPAVM